MKKILRSLQTKLIISFVVLIMVITGGTFFFTFGQTKKALLDITRKDMLQIIGMASLQFSDQEISQITQLKEGQDTTPEYLAFKRKFQTLRSLSPNIVNYYLMRIEGDKVFFLLDDYDDDTAALINQQYENPEKKIFDAALEPQASDDLYTDEWGTFLSAYAPVKDSQGKLAFIIGADMEAVEIIQRQDFIGDTIYFVMAFAILLAAVIIGIFSLTIIRDIKKLNLAAEKISTGDTNVTVDVKRTDEIGELAESFSRMVASLKIMMAGDDSPDEQNTPDMEH